jgi:hypothetical protein
LIDRTIKSLNVPTNLLALAPVPFKMWIAFVRRSDSLLSVRFFVGWKVRIARKANSALEELINFNLPPPAVASADNTAEKQRGRPFEPEQSGNPTGRRVAHVG